ISTGLQNGVPYQKFVKQFAKVNCISAIKNPSSEGHSCADVVGRCIELSAKNQSITTLRTGTYARWESTPARNATSLWTLAKAATRGSARTAAGQAAVDIRQPFVLERAPRTREPVPVSGRKALRLRFIKRIVERIELELCRHIEVSLIFRVPPCRDDFPDKDRVIAGLELADHLALERNCSPVNSWRSDFFGFDE